MSREGLHTRQAAALAWLAATTLASPAFADGAIHGRGRFEKIKGQPQAGYSELYESNLFLSPSSDDVIGPSRRLGAPPGKPPQHDGFYPVDDMPPGQYSILVSQPLFFIRPKVVPNVRVRSGKNQEINVELPLDYSTYFRTAEQWTAADTSWYQTFKANGIAISGVSFSLAGTDSPAADVTIMEDNGESDIRKWKLVGTTREPRIGANTDNWVRWRHGEIPTTPGKTYAVRITGVGGEGTFQPYKRDKDKDSYADGRAYNSKGQPQDFDVNYTVFADNDGTIVTVCKRNEGPGQLKDGYFSSRWGQTFIAKGDALAGVDVWAAGAAHKWDLDFAWTVREAGPAGKIIGPRKITRGAFQAFGSGLHGVSYNPNEVPLRAGRRYFIEFAVSHPPQESPGFNPYLTDDPYPDGTGYQWIDSKWIQRTDDDVSMTVIEYKDTGPRRARGTSRTP